MNRKSVAVKFKKGYAILHESRIYFPNSEADLEERLAEIKTRRRTFDSFRLDKGIALVCLRNQNTLLLDLDNERRDNRRQIFQTRPDNSEYRLRGDFQ